MHSNLASLNKSLFLVALVYLIGTANSRVSAQTLFFDNFDDADLSEYEQIGGNWSTVSASEGGSFLRQTRNAHTVLYAAAESFSGSYQVKAEIWNEDNDAAGVAFRVNTADGDNFYSCSATADSGFQAGIWRHVNDLKGTPTTMLAGVSWNYVRSRWYTVTITVDPAGIHCQWESQEGGIELDVTAGDPDPSSAGSIGVWLSSQANFRGDLLEVSSLGSSDTEPPEVFVDYPMEGAKTSSSFAIDYTATDNVSVSECRYELDYVSTDLPNCESTTLTSLSLKAHQLQVFATDASGHEGSSPLINFTVDTDNSPPEWDPVPEDQTILEGQLLSYQVNAVDNVGVSYSVDDTTHFTIGSTTGLLESKGVLISDTYPLILSAQDPTGNVINATITITVTTTPPVAFYEDFDDGDLSEYVQLGGNWSTVNESGRGLVLRQTGNAHTILFAASESFSGSYQVKAEIWNEDNDAAGVAFRVDTADGDNFYSCSATADSGFQAGIWQHVNDLNGTPTTMLAGVSWNYVRSRWYTVTITVDQAEIHCQWESQEGGIELDVTAGDPDPSSAGSIGVWLSSQDNFKGDVLEVSSLGQPEPPDTTPPEVVVVYPTEGTETPSSFLLDYTATDDVGVSECQCVLDSGSSTDLPNCESTTLTSLSMGAHQIQVFATDTSGNTDSSPLISFTVKTDNSPPEWDPVPEDQTLVEGQLLSYQVNAVDNDSVNYSINDNINFTINPTTGLLESNGVLSSGPYPLVLTVRDDAGNDTTAAITVTVTPPAPPVAFYDDFDDGDLSEYVQLGGSWSTVNESGRGLVLRHAANADTIIYAASESFSGSYQVKAEIWNEDNDAVGVAFRVDTADGDNFYSCSASADSAFQSGIWQHVNDLADAPTTMLAGVSWNYVRSRWYTVTITVDQVANTILCQWESMEGGIELDVTAVDPAPSSAGSIGVWLSSQDNFKGDLLEVSPLGPPDETPPEVIVTSPTSGTSTSTFDLIYTATDDVGVSACWYELDGSAGTDLPNCENTTLTSLSVDATHRLQVFATDASGNTGYSQMIEFTVTADNSPPEWDPVPEAQTILEEEFLSYQVNAVDNVGVDFYSIDDTVNFTIDPATGLLESTTALALGSYPLEISAQDTNGLVSTAVITVTVVGGIVPPPNFTVAFIGDQGRGDDARAVLELILNEGAGMVLHQGDFDYADNPDAWDGLITDVLGADFPYFASVGNHDTSSWGGSNGYQAKLLERLSRIPEASCSGDYGVNSSCTYNGVFFILSGVGTTGSGHDIYIQDQLAQTDYPWRICSWHKTMEAMQVGGKGNSTGWGVYEACREGGAIIATAHEHSYHRTKTLINTETQTVDPDWPLPDEVRVALGSTFVHVSGLGGASIRDQERCLPDTPPYGCNGEWANIYTSNQGANYGALFCSFNVNGQADKAECYFRDIDGNIPDQFNVTNFLFQP